MISIQVLEIIGGGGIFWREKNDFAGKRIWRENVLAGKCFGGKMFGEKRIWAGKIFWREKHFGGKRIWAVVWSEIGF